MRFDAVDRTQHGHLRTIWLVTAVASIRFDQRCLGRTTDRLALAIGGVYQNGNFFRCWRYGLLTMKVTDRWGHFVVHALQTVNML